MHKKLLLPSGLLPRIPPFLSPHLVNDFSRQNNYELKKRTFHYWTNTETIFTIFRQLWDEGNIVSCLARKLWQQIWQISAATSAFWLGLIKKNNPLRLRSRSPVNSRHKCQWRGTLMFSMICVWINDWVNNREAGYLRRYRAHYDVTLMLHSGSVRALLIMPTLCVMIIADVLFGFGI